MTLLEGLLWPETYFPVNDLNDKIRSGRMVSNLIQRSANSITEVRKSKLVTRAIRVQTKTKATDWETEIVACAPSRVSNN